MDQLDIEAAAVRAVQQARLLVHRAEMEATVAVRQAVWLLHDQGMSHREIARLTGLSKSDVARKSSHHPPIGIAQNPRMDGRVHDFALEWLWGSQETASDVMQALLTDQ